MHVVSVKTFWRNKIPTIKMKKTPNPLFPKIKSGFKIFIPYVALVIILSAIGYLAWLNHNDFEKTIINQTKTQLLITALSEAQSIEKDISGTGVSAERINGLVKHINELERVYMFIINDNAQIISYPYTSYIGKNALALIKGKTPNPDWLKLNAVMRKIKNGEQGTEILDFFSENKDPQIVKTLVAFAPMRINNNRCSIIVAMEYNVVANPIHKNVRENLLLLGFAGSVLAIFSSFFYRIHKEKDKLALSELTLNIINRQLHLEIDERKKT